MRCIVRGIIHYKNNSISSNIISMIKSQKNKNYTKSAKIYEYDTSDDEENISDNINNAMTSSLVAIANNTNNTATLGSDNSTKTNEKKPTETRIEFVKNLLDGNKLKAMVDFDTCDTESATNSRLNKKIMDIKELFNKMNVKLKYLKSGTTGHTFKAISNTDKNVAFAVKVCAYPKDDYGAINNISRPENAELRMLKLLSYFVITRKTPHFVLPIGTFNTSITNFINISKIDLDDKKNEMYKSFIDRYHKGEFEDFVSILISEWCNGGDLLDYIRNNYTTMTLRHWIVIIFQILFTLALVQQKYPAFRHNDLKANNILVQKMEINKEQENCRYRYNIGNTKFIIPNIGIQIKIWDFDFACIDGVIDNNKVNSDWTKKINISKKENKYYDMHYLFNTLISKRFFPDFYTGGAPQQIIDFVHRIIPEDLRNGSEHINKKGRILINTEYTTPYKVIMEDPLFDKYRYQNIN